MDDRNNAKECKEVLTAQSVVPWIRIDTQAPHDDPNKLTMQLLQSGGRNSPVLATFPIPDPYSHSAQGGFSYTLSFKTFNTDYSVASQVDCEVRYDGSYCPQYQTTDGSTVEFNFSADGSIACAVNYADGRTPARCEGTLRATNASLLPSYNGA